MDEPAREELGRRGVTRREVEVLEAVAERLTNAEIAARLCVSERTVESHVSSLLRKLGAHTRVDLADWAGPGGRTGALGDTFPHQLLAVAERGVCVGRDDERERLLTCWERSATRTTVAVVRGEAGIGKSRLVADVAVEVHRCGGGVALGACTDGPQRPYEPFMAAIEADLGHLSPDDLARRLATSSATLARLSPDVATRLQVVGQDVVAPERERGEVQAALLEYLTAAARTRRLLFVIEDLHWASVATRDVVAHISRVGGGAPLMVLVTTRDERPFVENAFGAFLGRLTGLASVEIVTLSGLDAAAAATVIGAAGGDLEPVEAVRQTGGNPLFLRELAREGPGSRSLRELVTDRFNRLCASDLDVLDLAAVAGEQIDVPLLASALDRSVDDVLDALERAEGTGLIGAGARPGCLAFTHDLFRSVRYSSLTTVRRFRLHAALAVALRDQAPDGPVSADLARHACLAGPRFDPRIAADLARRAGDATAYASDYGEAAAHYRRAVEALDLVPGADDRERLDLTTRLGASLVQIGDADGETILRAAAQTALRRADPVALARAVGAMVWSPSGSASPGPADQSVRSLAEAALAALPASDQARRVRIQALLGLQLLLTDAPDRGTALIDAAVDAARRLGDPLKLGSVLAFARFCGGPMEMDQRLACGQELLELGKRTGREFFSFQGCLQLWWCHRELGSRADMEYWYEAAAARIHGPDVEQLSYPPAAALMDGQLDRAQQLTDDLDDWSVATRGYVAQFRVAIQDIRGHSFDPTGLTDELSAAIIPGEFLEALLARACARSAAHRSRVKKMLDDVRRRGFPPMYAPRGGAMTLCGWSEAAAIVNDVPAAQELRELLDPLAGRLVDGGVLVWDTIDRVRALLLLATGDPAAAAELAGGAVAASRQRRTPIFLARELIVFAAATQRLGGDASSAVEEALAIARRTGARMIAKDAELFLTEQASAVGLGDELGLTPHEREILDLVAEGATNAQIAAALDVSAATVRKHLEHAYAKLNVSTRTAAVARIRPSR